MSGNHWFPQSAHLGWAREIHPMETPRLKPRPYYTVYGGYSTPEDDQTAYTHWHAYWIMETRQDLHDIQQQGYDFCGITVDTSDHGLTTTPITITTPTNTEQRLSRRSHSALYRSGEGDAIQP